MGSDKKENLLSSRLPDLHDFFLNPYEDVRFSTCPICNNKTKIRKKPFLIHIDPRQLLILNMSGPYCPYCDLMILHKDVMEELMANAFHERRPEIVGNPYLVLGTVERSFWLRSLKESLDPQTIFANLHSFKNALVIDRPKWGWILTDEP
jgi:thiol-disulfide isomerase/thioredoxin